MTGSVFARYESRGTFHVIMLAALRLPRRRCRREIMNKLNLKSAIGG